MKTNKAAMVGVAGIVSCIGIIAYAAYKNHKDKKLVKEVIEEEKIDEAMVEAIKDVTDPDMTNLSKFERTFCVSMLKGHRAKVLTAKNITELRTSYMEFNVVYNNIRADSEGAYFSCIRYLNELNRSNEKIEDTSTGDLCEIVLRVTELGMDLLSKRGC